MREANEVWLVLGLVHDLIRDGHHIHCDVLKGVPKDAVLVGVEVRFPYPTTDVRGGVLVLKYDRPVPDVTFRDLREFPQSLADGRALDAGSRG